MKIWSLVASPSPSKSTKTVKMNLCKFKKIITCTFIIDFENFYFQTKFCKFQNFI